MLMVAYGMDIMKDAEEVGRSKWNPKERVVNWHCSGRGGSVLSAVRYWQRSPQENIWWKRSLLVRLLLWVP